MKAIGAVLTLLIGVAIILAGSGLLGTLLGVRGQFEGFESAAMGVIMAGYFVGYVIGTFWVPRLIRRVGHIRAFAALASLASVATLLHGLYIQPLSWFLLRVAAGICVVGLYIAIESWLNERTTNEERGSVFSAYMTTTLIGLGIGQLLLLSADISGLELFALASVLLSVGLVPIAMTRVHEPSLAETTRVGIRSLYAISPVGVVGCLFSGLGTGAFWGLAPVFAAELGFTTQGISLFMSLTILGGIVMMWPVGRMSDHYDRRRVLAVACALTSAAASVTAGVASLGQWPVLLGGFVYGCFAFSLFSLATAHTNDHVERDQVLEVTSGLQLLWGCGAIIGPIVAGALMQALGPETLMLWFAAVALLLAGFVRFRMAVSKPIPLDEQGDFVPHFATSSVALEMHPEGEASDPADDPEAAQPRAEQ